VGKVITSRFGFAKFDESGISVEVEYVMLLGRNNLPHAWTCELEAANTPHWATSSDDRGGQTMSTSTEQGIEVSPFTLGKSHALLASTAFGISSNAQGRLRTYSA
jgi:hypothetical protein